ncbi:DUF1645 family protein [Quillaja saponaria]|uniref:DUF1645 family protein n=1 Tax=Quillaja saponaria TaxID=32244 RepID=A0AAD7LDP6_QUISA|nr:DUF1645 family protein [Quillaja saponaria]
MQVEGSGLSVSPSPSFNSYSSGKLAEIAARVIEEFRRDSDDALFKDSWENENRVHGNDDVEEDDDDFEFAFVSRESDSSPIAADEIFYNGQIKPTYPIFDLSLLDGADGIVCRKNDDVDAGSVISKETSTVRGRRLPLRKLMFEERETESVSSSTSETDDNDLDGVPAGTYCVWNPKSAAIDSPGRSCKKSKSTGSSSKRWKLRDLLLKRSQSDGKESLLLLTPSKRRTNKMDHEVSVSKLKAKENPNSCDSKVAATDEQEEHYVTSTSMNETEEGDKTKRRSFVEYKQDMVGVFSNVNGLSRNLHPF